MSSKTKKSKIEEASYANLVKSSKKYSKRQIVSPRTSSKRVSEKELQLSTELSIERINQEKLSIEKGSHNPLPCNMSSKTTKAPLKNGTTLPENGFSQDESIGVCNPIGFYGKDWDEMEFLESSSPTKNYNTLKGTVRTTSEALNGKYARTRKNLGQKMSADTIVGNGLAKEASKQSSKNSTSKKLTKQSSVISSPIKSSTPLNLKTTLKSSTLLNKTSSSKEVRPSLLDMVKIFSAGSSLAASDSPPCKAAPSKSSSSFIKYLNKIRSEPPRANSVTDVSLQSLVPDSIEISLVPKTSESPFKSSNFHAKNSSLNESIQIRKQPLISNTQLVEKSGQGFKVKPSFKKRSAEPVENVTKKSKSMENDKTKKGSETIHNTSLHSSSETDVIGTGHISDKDISSWLDEEIKKGAEDLKKRDSSRVNSVSQVLTLDSALGTGNVLNQTPTSYMFTSSLPNPLSNTFVPPSANNNVIYDVNSLNLYPPAANPPSTTVFILPVASNFSPAAGNGNSLPPSQPILKVSCNGMDADSVFKSICKTFYQSAGTTIQSSENANALYPGTSNSVIQTNSLIHTSLNASASTSTQLLEACGNNLLIPRAKSNLEPLQGSDVREVSTVDRSSLLWSYFCDLMKNRPKLSLEQYKKEANKVLDLLSSFPHYLSVKYFCSNAEEYFSDLCFCDASSKSTAFKFEENFQDSRLSEILKKYVSFQMKEIVKSFPQKPFCLKSNLIFKARNSKLTYFEKLILKKVLKYNQEVDLEELIGRLFLVGLVVVFSELKKHQQL